MHYPKQNLALLTFFFKTKCLGAMLGFLCALVGSTFFSIFVVVRSVFTIHNYPSINFLIGFFIAVTFWGSTFAFIPAGVGGWILEIILRKFCNKGLLTEKNAIKSGIALAGLAGITTSVIGILFIMLMPHSYWITVIDEILQGNIFAHFYSYLLAFMKAIIGFFPEILTVITIACLSGGLTGWILAKQFLNPQTIPS